MDPSTTLMTFLLETEPSVNSVQLIGSWDNFSTWYTMKQDLRRGRGQWRGCYSFKDVISCDDPSHHISTRNGGLKMGNTYYYYYEVDGSTEIHDPAQPSTNACPYMPGQTVNTLHVPIEQSLRHRSVSVNSLRRESYMTMNPEARYITPVPALAASVNGAGCRLGSASSLLYNRQSNRSESVGPSWKRFFSRKLVCRGMERPATSGRSRDGAITPSSWPLPDSRPTSSSDGRRTRDISPESLRRFLVEDPPLPPEPSFNNLPTPLEIPNEPGEEVDDDDENFATSAISETQVFATRLSPPPFQRSVSADTLPQTVANSSSLTLTIRPTSKEQSPTFQEPLDVADISQLPKPDASKPNHCDWSPSISSSTFATPMSPQSLAEELPSFYDSNDEDVLSSNDGDYLSYGPRAGLATRESFKGYSLPRHVEEHKSADNSRPRMTGFNTASVLAGHDSSIPIGGTNYLGATIDTGLDDFVNELGLMVDDIGKQEQLT